jgi:hypothetical protein
LNALYLHETASVGLRAEQIAGVGAEHARLVRLFLLSYTRWPGQAGQSPWPANTSLAARTRLTERQIERALVVLREAEIITTRVGRRVGARRPVGRLIDIYLHAPCKALAPDAVDVESLWAVTRSLRERPAALVTAMVGAFMLASDVAGGPINEWSDLGCSMSAWRRFIGHADNASWTKRVRELEGLGLLRREGRMIFVSPPRAWFMLMVSHAEAKRFADAPPVLVRLRPAARTPAPEPAHSDFKPDNGRVIALPQRARAADLPMLAEGPILRVEWIDLRDISDATGTGSSRRMLAGRGPP